jgi:large subunit ribosomal protein L6
MLAAKSCVKFGNTMSRIGKKIIAIPSGVTVTVTGNMVSVKGTKGELFVEILPGITVEVIEGNVEVKRTDDLRQTRAFHGLIRSLINNHIIGVATGYKKTLQLVGTGYRVAMKGQGITLSLGFSHPVDVVAPAGITIKVEGNDIIHIEGSDKTVVGQVAANIRKIRPPEPYKGKGIRYSDEVVRRKAGKAAAK